ncbi:conserved hypothetical protein [Leishmania major strain Friedlin]|uniref:Uncharacterized protein n=1 Tax=Leishmania major TaxID=5664 RepID=Q4QET9_LEIMA|nr:conserved hypothetical protein [Leishmania major strain Friedlin]CAG9572115.1 Membrane_transport_protein_-_putative [Leishmania major strain Friedlin]CAJ03662.1 conserved hypothetical protein [Leishmania major strain Friedlin]|eukprot:XP_001682159.1 conserved hypothetical protein [Leishmania major strain Friedlin]
MDILGVTFIAVSKVIVAVLVGVFTTDSIPNSKITLHNFAFLISSLLLASLTLSNTAKSIDLDVLFRCSILILFSLISIASGLLWGAVLDVLFFRLDPKYSGIPEELRKDVRLELLYDRVTDEGAEAHCLPSSSPTTKGPGTKAKRKKTSVPYVVVVLSEHFREVGVTGSEIVNALEVPDERQEDCAGYRYAAWVGCSTQNGVTLPLSLMSNVASSISFIDMTHSAAYIFVFSISYMLYLWSACPAIVEAGQKAAKKQRLIREILLKHKRMMARCDATTQTLSLPVSQVLESAEDLEEDVEVDSCDSEAGQARRLECQVDRFTQLYLAVSDPSSSSTSCSDNTSSLEAGGVANTDGCSSRADRHVHSATYSFDLITSLQSSFTQMRRLARISGKRGAAEVTFKILGTPATRSPTAADERAFAMSTAEQLPYDWAAAGYIRFKYESELKALRTKSASEKVQQLGRASWVLVKKLMTSPPFLSVVLGIVIGIVPPVRRLSEHWPLPMVMDAIRLIGEGSIPSSLLLLGANLAVSSSANAAESAEVRLRHAEQNTEYPLLPEEWQLLGEDVAYARWYDAQHTDMEFDLHESFSLQTLMQRGLLHASMMPGGASAASAAPMGDDTDEEGGGAKKGTFMDGVQRTLSLKGIRPAFVWGIIIFRMLISPTLSFFLLIFLIDKMPFLFGGRGSLDKTLIMVLMVELAAPTAINSTLLFNAYKFMTYQWAKMLFFQYILCVLSMVMWASIGLSYVSSL